MKKFTSIMALLLAVLMLFSFVSCKPKTPPTPTPDPGEGEGEGEGSGEITVEKFEGEFTWKDAVSTLATNWNPHTYETSDDSYPLDFIITGLYTFVFNDELNAVDGKDPYSGYKIIPEMAAEMPVDVTEEIKALENNKFNIPADAKTGYAYKIALNKDAKWQDGTPINADTYVYSMKQLLNPELINYRATDYVDGDLAIAGGKAYSLSGRTIKAVNGISDSEVTHAWATLTKGEDGVYVTADGAKTWICLNEKTLPFCSGYSLTELAQMGYVQKEVYDGLAALGDDEGNVPVTDESRALLLQFTTSDNWGNEPESTFEFYISYDKTYDTFAFENVGIIKNDEYTITLVLEKSLSGFYLLYNLSGNWLVYKDLYESCLEKVGDGYVSSYNTSVATTMSYGPYKMTSYQEDKGMTFEKNENWHGYTDGKHIYKDPTDGKYYPMYQTTKVECQVVEEADTRKLMFLKGELMGYGLQAADFETYRSSEYCYASPATSTFFLILNGHAAAIKSREEAEDFDTTKYDLQCMMLESFKRGMALSYDRDLFASTVSPSRSAGYGLIGTAYIYDPDTGAKYRDTDQAKKALCDFYSVDVSKYPSLDAAVDSITGYDVEGARAFFKKAFDEAIEAGYITDADNDGKSDQIVQMQYCLSSDSDFMTTTIAYLNSALADVLVGTPFEGKIEFIKSPQYGNAWSAKIKAGLADTVLGGWSGSALNPFSLTDLYANPARAYDAAWFDATAHTMTLTIGGEEVTLNLKQWSDALNGAAVEVDGKTYNYGDGQADIETRLSILAAFETKILGAYNYLPVLEDGSMALLSQQVYYVVEDYNQIMGRGGIAYTKYNFNDAEWKAHVEAQGGELKY